MLRVFIRNGTTYRFLCPYCGKTYVFNIPYFLLKSCINCKTKFPAVDAIVEWEDARLRYYRNRKG